MKKARVVQKKLSEFSLWEKSYKKNLLIDIELELTARCNNNCRHCYINLPPGDKKTQEEELTFEEILKFADEAVSLGAMGCLITGGEPLLRQDFVDIYISLKKKGLLLSVFTNATLITEKHIELFKKYPPRELEVSVYGVTKETYERVTRKPGSFNSFIKGVDMLLKNEIKTTFKAVALRSNYNEMPLIAEFCKQRTKDYFRFDPLLHLRFDRDEKRNREIIEERLTPKEIVELEKSDPKRFSVMKKECSDILVKGRLPDKLKNILFRCGVGVGACTIGYNGIFRLCSSLWHPDCIYDLRKGSLTDAYKNLVPKVRGMKTNNKNFLEKCGQCKIINLCLWCPAHTYLETGFLDEPIDTFCEIAKARVDMLKKGM